MTLNTKVDREESDQSDDDVAHFKLLAGQSQNTHARLQLGSCCWIKEKKKLDGRVDHHHHLITSLSLVKSLNPSLIRIIESNQPRPYLYRLLLFRGLDIKPVYLFVNNKWKGESISAQLSLNRLLLLPCVGLDKIKTSPVTNIFWGII